MAGIYKDKPQYNKQIKGKLPRIPKVNRKAYHKMDDAKEFHNDNGTTQTNIDFSKLNRGK